MLTVQRLQELLSYNSQNGKFTYKENKFERLAGAVAGHFRKGYRYISIQGKSYKASHLAWLYVYGYLPKQQIDHWDGNKANDAITNLREVIDIINQQNRRRVRKDSKTKVMGVTRNKNRYIARIRLNGLRIFLGSFITPEEAHAVYLAAKRKLHPGCTI